LALGADTLLVSGGAAAQPFRFERHLTRTRFFTFRQALGPPGGIVAVVETIPMQDVNRAYERMLQRPALPLQHRSRQPAVIYGTRMNP
jgi:hypothetical protein